MHDLTTICATARSSGRKLLSLYLTTGYPQRTWTAPLATAIFAGGADLLELGIPYSDPIADGPVIQSASTASLASGTRLADVFSLATEISPCGPVLLMGYYNSVLGSGAEKFITRAAESAVSGLIIPDLLWGEDPEFWQACAARKLPIIPFVAPTTTAARLAEINRVTTPFVYAVSITGVTGARASLPLDVRDYLTRARAALTAPLLVGFGISTPNSARELKLHCDGVIVGSALINLIQKSATLSDACESVREFVAELRTALDS
jgi:tryptophan synthase alpha chain